MHTFDVEEVNVSVKRIMSYLFIKVKQKYLIYFGDLGHSTRQTLTVPPLYPSYAYLQVNYWLIIDLV
jgi:hypothetical protein